MFQELTKYEEKDHHLTKITIDHPFISVRLAPPYPVSDIPPYGRKPYSIAIRNLNDLKSVDVFYSFTYHYQPPSKEEQQIAMQQGRQPKPSFNPAYGLPVVALAAKFGPNEQPFHLGGDVLHLACPLAEEKDILEFSDLLLTFKAVKHTIKPEFEYNKTLSFCTPRNFAEFIVTSHEDHIPDCLRTAVNIDVLRDAFQKGYPMADAQLNIPADAPQITIPVNRTPE